MIIHPVRSKWGITFHINLEKKVYDWVHHYAATLEIVHVDFIDVLRLGDDCADIFCISYFMLRYDILCCHIKKHSYDSPSSPEDELQGVSPHVFCLHSIGKPIHDQDIYNNSTNFIHQETVHSDHSSE